MAVPNDAPAMIQRAPFRLGAALVFLAFYLWIVHSYKLPSADVAILGLGVGVLARGGTLRVPAPVLFFGLFVIWSALGLLVTLDDAITTEALINLVKLWVIFFLVVNAVRTAGELRFLIIAWLGVFALYPVRGAFYNQYICNCTEFGRVAWNFIFDNPNDLAALSLVPLGLTAGVAILERVKIWRAAGWLGMMVLAVLIMLTQSRGAMIAMGVAAVLLPITSRKRGRDVVVLVLLVGGAAIMAPKDVWQRLAGLANLSVETGMVGVDPEGSAEARWQIWQVALSSIEQKPILGVGAGMMPTTHRFEAIRRNLPFTMRGTRDTHSTYIRIAAEQGIPGLVIYLLMWGSIFLHLRRARRSVKDARPREYQALVFLELASVAFLVAATFGTYGTIAFTYISASVIWLTAAVLAREPWYVPSRRGQVPIPDVQPGRR